MTFLCTRAEWNRRSAEDKVSWCFTPSQPVWLYQGDLLRTTHDKCETSEHIPVTISVSHACVRVRACVRACVRVCVCEREGGECILFEREVGGERTQRQTDRERKTDRDR